MFALVLTSPISSKIARRSSAEGYFLIHSGRENSRTLRLRNSWLRLASGAVCGSLVGWLLFSPHWSLPANPLAETQVVADLLRPVVSAVGAGLEVIVVAVPLPFQGFRKALVWMRAKLGVLWPAVVALERRTLLIAGFSMALVLAMLCTLIIFGPKQPNILLGAIVLVALFAVRFYWNVSPSVNGLIARSTRDLEISLRRDAEAMLAYVAGIDEPEAVIDNSLRKEVTVFLARSRHMAPEDVVDGLCRMLELDPAQTHSEHLEGEFAWSVKRSGEYEKHGIVREGDVVMVLRQPVVVYEKGQRKVVEKGIVSRKIL